MIHNSIAVKIDKNKFKSITEACKFYKMDRNIVKYRLKQGWDTKTALSTKIKNTQITINGKSFRNISCACRFYNVDRNLIAGRLREKWSLDEAFGLSKRAPYSKVTVNNIVFDSLNAACKAFKIRQTTIKRRLNKGWSIDAAFGIVEHRYDFSNCNGKIYKIYNIINNKVYIGFTTQSLKERFLRHKNDASRGSNTKIHKAMRKYGFDNFYIVLLKRINNRRKLALLEIKYIKKYNSVKMGYNTCNGGNGGCGKSHGSPVEFEGRKFTSKKELANYLDMNYGTLLYRIKHRLISIKEENKNGRT